MSCARRLPATEEGQLSDSGYLLCGGLSLETFLRIGKHRLERRTEIQEIVNYRVPEKVPRCLKRHLLY